MPSDKSARVSLRKQQRNAPLRTRAKTYVRRARTLIAARDLDTAGQAVREAVVALDKAAQKGVIHANNAGRRKSRIVQQLNKALDA